MAVRVLIVDDHETFELLIRMNRQGRPNRAEGG
jgi:hypothetical protein